MSVLSRWVREPLIHFLLLGALIFFVYEQLAGKGSEPDEIYISKGQQENLINTFNRTWQRAPTPQEFQGLLQDYLRQEIAYRESRSMGLDENDIVIRRRLRQKLELLAEDVVSLSPPTDQELQDYLGQHADSFRLPPSYTLSQVYFSSDRRGEQARADALQVLEQLRAGELETPVEELGDSLPLPSEMSMREDEISRLFGSSFATGLADLQAGQWEGPIPSGYGIHLVYIQQRSDARVPALDEIRDGVQREWLNVRRQQSIDALYEKMAENYTIEIEPLVEMAGAE